MEKQNDILNKATGALKNEQVPTAPPQNVVDSTIARLTTAEPARFKLPERGRPMKMFTKIAATAVIIIAALVGIRQLAERRSTAPDEHSRDAEHQPEAGLRGRPGIDEQVAEASLIVRGRVLEKTYTGRQVGDEREVQLSIEVDKVLYGKLPTRIISALDWESTDNPIIADVRNEGILFLHECKDGHWRIRSGYTKYADLDAVEKQILEVIESGAHLTARSRGRAR